MLFPRSRARLPRASAAPWLRVHVRHSASTVAGTRQAGTLASNAEFAHRGQLVSPYAAKADNGMRSCVSHRPLSILTEVSIRSPTFEFVPNSEMPGRKFILGGASGAVKRIRCILRPLHHAALKSESFEKSGHAAINRTQTNANFAVWRTPRQPDRAARRQEALCTLRAFASRAG